MELASYLLSAMNFIPMTLSLTGRWKWAIGCYLVAQIPWSVYDVKTGQPGLLLISAGTVISCYATWRVRRRKYDKSHG